ncbi:PilZ domain-containing protein [Bdellovibrio sp. HCB337]|uniref:PilZ domain-containing protein n=1 Tax=Bdellovibrio sp. HCB337 TaxID=3394358 RepID=UPI0039A61AF2
MNQSLARYHARSPRYILNTDDDSLIRVAGPRQVPWEEGTEIKNVSLTGLAFVAPEDLCPILGEIVKIQFQPPGAKQLASYAIVTRLDPLEDGKILVGLHFYKMEMGHRVALAQGLARKLKEISDREKILHLQEGTRFSLTNFPQWFLMANFFVLWVLVMHLLAQENWLQNFKAWLGF